MLDIRPVEELRSVSSRPEAQMSRACLVAVWLVQVMLVLSVIPWRRDAIFDGGLDPTVVGKALVAVGALLVVVLIARTSSRRYPIGLGPTVLIAFVTIVSLLGAFVAGDAMSTIVLTVRVAIVVITILLLLRVVSWEVGVGSLLAAMGAVALIAGVTGVPSLISEGRLAGGVPQLHPNPLAELAGAPLVWLAVQILRRGVRIWWALSFLMLLAIIIGTGSRTAVIALTLALAVAVMVNGIQNRSVVYLLLVSAPVLYAFTVLSDAIQQLATRAGSTDTTSTLEARFVAWRVVLGWSWTAWEKWIGVGLATKTVPVDARWHDEQVLDSSWVSILAQSGVLGVTLMGVIVVWCVITAVTSKRRRWLVLPLLVLVLTRSITESGLMDGAMPFVQLLVCATVLTRRSRHSGRLDVCESPGVEELRRAADDSLERCSASRAPRERSAEKQ